MLLPIGLGDCVEHIRVYICPTMGGVMRRRPGNTRAQLNAQYAVTTQLLPVLETSVGDSVPFLPNQAVDGCMCFHGGRGGILLRTVDAPEADMIVVAGKPIGRLGQCMVPIGTRLKIGDRVGTLLIRPVQVTAGRLPRQPRAAFCG
jgi:hypothetical protein